MPISGLRKGLQGKELNRKQNFQRIIQDLKGYDK